MTDLAAPRTARDLAVVIVSYNVRDLLRGCLQSLREQVGPSLVVIVVDNRSRDGSADMVEREFPEVQLLASARNGGFANGNNQGLRAAPPARYVMLLNPDTVVRPGALAELVRFMDAHPEAGVVGPRLILANGRLDLACRRGFPSPEVAFYHAFWLDRWFPRSRT
ncbi:MAG: glycosyltransferase family 2 protein, partial [Chloroflexota bacterium]